MLSVSHALTGSLIAVKLGNPLLAAPLILAAHYLQDAVPHWDVGTGLSSGKKTSRKALLHELPDLLLAGILVIVLFDPQLSIIHRPSTILSAPIWGAFLGLLPDFLEAPRNFLKWEPKWLSPLNRFHHAFHHSIPRPVDGLAPQLLLLILIWLVR